MKLAAVTILTSITQWLMNLCNNRITYRVVNDVRTDAFEHLQKLPLKYIDSHQYGEIISRVITDVEQFSDGLLMGFSQLFTGIVTIVGTLIFMVSIHFQISLIVILITPLSFFVAGFVAKKTYMMFRKQSEVRGELTSLTDEIVGNQKIVQAFGYQDRAMKRFKKVNEELKDCSVKAYFLFFHNKSDNPIYQRTCLCGCRDYRSDFCHSRKNQCRSVIKFLKLCKSIYEAV